MLKRYARDEVLSIEDITDFVAQQREYAARDFSGLLVPVEQPYVLPSVGRG